VVPSLRVFTFVGASAISAYVLYRGGVPGSPVGPPSLAQVPSEVTVFLPDGMHCRVTTHATLFVGT